MALMQALMGLIHITFGAFISQMVGGGQTGISLQKEDLIPFLYVRNAWIFIPKPQHP